MMVLAVTLHNIPEGMAVGVVYAGYLAGTAPVSYTHLDSPTIVVMTDRIDLDDQLYTQFAKCAPFLRQTPVQATSKENLSKLLDGRKANGIIFTTMFKFERGEKPLSERRNIEMCIRDRFNTNTRRWNPQNRRNCVLER